MKVKQNFSDYSAEKDIWWIYCDSKCFQAGHGEAIKNYTIRVPIIAQTGRRKSTSGAIQTVHKKLLLKPLHLSPIPICRISNGGQKEKSEKRQSFQSLSLSLWIKHLLDYEDIIGYFFCNCHWPRLSIARRTKRPFASRGERTGGIHISSRVS